MKNQEALFKLFISEVTKYENTTKISQVENYISQIANGRINCCDIYKLLTIQALNRLNFKSYCEALKDIDSHYPGFILLLLSTVVERINNTNSDYNIVNKIEKYYEDNAKSEQGNFLENAIWNENLQLIVNEVLSESLLVSDDEFFFARIKLLNDTGMLNNVLDQNIAYQLLIFNYITKNLIDKINPIYNGIDSARKINIPTLIKQYKKLTLDSINEKFLDCLDKEYKNGKSIILNNDTYSDNTEVQKYLKKYIAHIKIVNKDYFIKEGEEFITVLNRLNIDQFVEYFSYIEKKYAGVAIHYTMEARHSSSEREWNSFLIILLKFYKEQQLNKLYSSARKTLAQELLREPYEDGPDVVVYESEICSVQDFIKLLKNSAIFSDEYMNNE